ncbi:hypothetical protein Tco_0789728 [Tanacetum coccineum]
MPREDEVFLAEEQSLPAAVSPTADSPDEGDDKDESSEDDNVDIEADDDEEEEHPAPADSTDVALLAVDQAPSAEETKPFETDESAATPPPYPTYRVTARISIPAPLPTPVSYDAEIPFPPLPPIPSPSLPLSPPLHVSSPPPVSLIRSLGYRVAMIWLRAEAPSTSHSLLLPSTYHLTPPSGTPSLLPIPAPTSSPPLLLASTTRREDRHETNWRSYGRLWFRATLDDEIIRDLERDVGYRIIDSWDEIVEAMQGTPVVTNVAEFSQRMTEFETKLMAGWLNMLYRDRRAHARTARLIKTEARMSREAWGRSMNASDLARAEVMSLRTTVLAQ